ncbi:MAG: recombinase family protein, partial [Firmicutes bacterium]|nr:recombinase family protein [Bacillota bacterium]
CSASFGYRSSDGTLVPHEEEAPLVRRMYADFLDGKPIFAIVKEMNAMGVRTHRGNPFENRTVEYILRNPVYIGKLRWNPSGRTRRDWGNEHIILSPGNHAPLIDEETWNAAQRRLDEVKLQWGYKAKPSYNLKGWTSGIVRCASCGKTLVFSAPHYWKCNGYVHGSCQFSQHVRAGVLEQAIIDRLKDDCASASPLTFTVSCSGPSGGAELNRQEVILRQLRSKLSRLQDAYLSGVIDLACFAASKNDLDAAARQAEEKIAQIRSQCDPDSVNEKLRKNISHALQTLQSPDASIEEKNASARSIIESCTFSRNDRLLSITYRFIF